MFDWILNKLGIVKLPANILQWKSSVNMVLCTILKEKHEKEHKPWLNEGDVLHNIIIRKTYTYPSDCDIETTLFNVKVIRIAIRCNPDNYHHCYYEYVLEREDEANTVVNEVDIVSWQLKKKRKLHKPPAPPPKRIIKEDVSFSRKKKKTK